MSRTILLINGTLGKSIKDILKEENILEIECKIQNGTINDNGVNGIQIMDLVFIALEQLKKFQMACPSRETALTITKLEEALMWDEARTNNRIERNVEGTNQK